MNIEEIYARRNTETQELTVTPNERNAIVLDSSAFRDGRFDDNGQFFWRGLKITVIPTLP